MVRLPAAMRTTTPTGGSGVAEWGGTHGRTSGSQACRCTYLGIRFARCFRLRRSLARAEAAVPVYAPSLSGVTRERPRPRRQPESGRARVPVRAGHACAAAGPTSECGQRRRDVPMDQRPREEAGGSPPSTHFTYEYLSVRRRVHSLKLHCTSLRNVQCISVNCPLQSR